MLCKQCKSEVSVEDMALSGYRRQDGKRSRRSICRKCYNLNRFTSKACKDGDAAALEKALPVYKLISLNVYGAQTEWIPLSIQEAFYKEYPDMRPVSTDTSTNDDVLDAVDMFMQTYVPGCNTDVAPEGGFNANSIHARAISAKALPVSNTAGSGHSVAATQAPYEGLSKEANLIIVRFFEDLKLGYVEAAARSLYECCCDITKTTEVPLDGQVFTMHPARTDLQLPSDFLDEIYDAAENIFDEESCILFGCEITPKNTKAWTMVYLQLMQVFQITPM